MENNNDVRYRFFPVNGHENYGVNAMGQVCNLKTGRVLKPDTNDRGYARVTLDGKKCLVHRLVAERFVENKYDHKKIIHVDGDVSNNSFTNLLWVNDHAIHNEEFRNYLQDFSRGGK